MADLKRFGQELAVFRLAAGFPTHEAAAIATGIERATIVRHEGGKGGVPQGNTLARYEKAYGLPAGSLLRMLRGEAGRLSERSATYGEPRHQRSLPFAVREYLAKVQLRLVKAGASDEEIEHAMRLLKSPEVFVYSKGGTEAEADEEKILRTMHNFVEGVIVPTLRDLGRKL